MSEEEQDERKRVDLTPKQREVLTRRYEEYARAKEEHQKASQLLNDLCSVLAGEDYQLGSESGQIVLERGSQ